MPDSTPPPLAPRRDAACLAALAFAVYCAFAQVTIYGDGFQFVVWVTSGQLFHNVHYFYLPLLHLLDRTVGATEIGFYAAACGLSAAGAAVGVLFTHLGCRRLGWTRGACLLVAGLVATAPSVFFFATVLEVHAVFFGVAGAAFYAATRIVQPRASLAWGAVFGTCTGLSFAVHASGVALLFAFGLWALAEGIARGLDRLRLVRQLAIGASIHATCVAAALVLVPWFSQVSGENAIGFWSLYEWRPIDEILLPTIFYEWLWAFMPASLWFLLGFARASQRLQAGALTLSLVPYLIVALKLVPAANEHGAYLIPLVIPAALITVACSPRWFAAILVVAALATSIAIVVDHDEPEPSRSMAAGVRGFAGDRAVSMFVADQHGMQACMSYLPDSTMFWLGNILALPPNGTPILEAALDRTLREARADDRVVVIPAITDTFLQTQQSANPIARGMLDYIDRNCDSEPIERLGFRGRRIVLRP